MGMVPFKIQTFKKFTWQLLCAGHQSGSSHLIEPSPLEVGTIILPISQMRKLRLSEVNSLLGHTELMSRGVGNGTQMVWTQNLYS